MASSRRPAASICAWSSKRLRTCSRRWRPGGAPVRRSWGSPPSTASGAIEYGRGKLQEKGLDAVVVNDISRSDIGIGADDNEVAILTAAGEQHVPRAAKAEVAAAILDAVERLRVSPPGAPG